MKCWKSSAHWVVGSCDIALVHDPRTIAFGELSLSYVSSNDQHDRDTGYAYNTVPHSSVVPENDILLLVRMSVDVLW